MDEKCQHNIPTDLRLQDNGWKTLVKKYFGKKLEREYRSMALDILAISKGIKTGFLFDYTSAETGKLQEFIEEIYLSKLVEKKLNIISIGMDSIIVNMDRLSNARSDWDKFNFIDISSSLDNPNIIPSTSEQLCPTRCMYEQLQRSLNQTVSDNDTTNPSTLFGLLIGYPAVYWYARTSTNDNCLDMVPLNAIQVYWGRHQLYSFSIPVCVWGELEKVVREWFELLQSDGCHVPSLRLKIETVCLPQVCL